VCGASGPRGGSPAPAGLTSPEHAGRGGSSGSPRSASCLTRRPTVCSPSQSSRVSASSADLHGDIESRPGPV